MIEVLCLRTCLTVHDMQAWLMGLQAAWQLLQVAWPAAQKGSHQRQGRVFCHGWGLSAAFWKIYTCRAWSY